MTGQAIQDYDHHWTPHVVESLILHINYEIIDGNYRSVENKYMYVRLLEAWCLCGRVGEGRIYCIGYE